MAIGPDVMRLPLKINIIYLGLLFLIVGIDLGWSKTAPLPTAEAVRV